MKVLEDCKDPVSLDIWRQTTFNSAASSPIPITQTTMSTKSEQMSYSKPETMVVKRNAWENNSSPDSNKNLKTSESQTDSVKHDSKFHHGNSRHKESEHKQGLLKKFFGGNTRVSKNHDKPHDLDENHVSSMATSCISQQTTDDDIWKDLGLHPSTMDKKNDHIQKSSRKREYEVENNGTWPKCNRIIPPQVNGTVMLPSPRKKPERPSILHSLDGTQKIPPAPPERSISSFEAVRHSPQSSDSTVKYHHSPQSSDSTVRRFPSYSPVSSPKPRTKSSPFLQTNSTMSTSMTPYSYLPDSYLQPKTIYPSRNSPHVPQKPYLHTGRHYDVPLISPCSRDITREPGVNKPQRRRPVERDRDRERRHHFSGPHSKSSHPFNTSSDSQNSRMSTSSPRWSSDTSTFDSLHSPPYLSERIPSTSSFPSSRGSHYGSVFLFFLFL